MRKRLVALTAILMMCPSLDGATAAAQERALLVIVNPNNPVQSLDALQLSALFTSNRRFWPNGDAVVAFNAPPRSANRAFFDRIVLGLTPDQAGRFWIDRQVRGGARPPRTAHSTRLAHAAVKKLRNAITYVPADRCPDGVRIVATVRNGHVQPSHGSISICAK